MELDAGNCADGCDPRLDEWTATVGASEGVVDDARGACHGCSTSPLKWVLIGRSTLNAGVDAVSALQRILRTQTSVGSIERVAEPDSEGGREYEILPAIRFTASVARMILA